MCTASYFHDVLSGKTTPMRSTDPIFCEGKEDLFNWRMYLPPAKRGNTLDDGQVPGDREL